MLHDTGSRDNAELFSDFDTSRDDMPAPFSIKSSAFEEFRASLGAHLRLAVQKLPGIMPTINQEIQSADDLDKLRHLRQSMLDMEGKMLAVCSPVSLFAATLAGNYSITNSDDTSDVSATIVYLAIGIFNCIACLFLIAISFYIQKCRSDRLKSTNKDESNTSITDEEKVLYSYIPHAIVTIAVCSLKSVAYAFCVRDVDRLLSGKFLSFLSGYLDIVKIYGPGLYVASMSADLITKLFAFMYHKLRSDKLSYYDIDSSFFGDFRGLPDTCAPLFLQRLKGNKASQLMDGIFIPTLKYVGNSLSLLLPAFAVPFAIVLGLYANWQAVFNGNNNFAEYSGFINSVIATCLSLFAFLMSYGAGEAGLAIIKAIYNKMRACYQHHGYEEIANVVSESGYEENYQQGF